MNIQNSLKIQSRASKCSNYTLDNNLTQAYTIIAITTMNKLTFIYNLN